MTAVGVGSPPVLVDERRVGHHARRTVHRRSAQHDAAQNDAAQHDAAQHDGRSRRSRIGGDDAEDEDEDEGEGEEEGEREGEGAEGADARNDARNDARDDEGIPSEGRGALPARRYLLVVNDCDVVPRKLRSQWLSNEPLMTL